MMELSFAWTVDALLAGRKVRTRRCWADVHAARFHKGDLVRALDRDRRAGGKPIATIRLTADPYRQPLDQMAEADLALEGGLWDSLDHFREGFPCQEPFVLDFEIVSVESRAYRGALARIEFQTLRGDELHDEMRGLRRRNDELVARLAKSEAGRLRGISVRQDGNGYLWLTVVAPTGKTASINLTIFAAKRGGVVGLAMLEWAEASLSTACTLDAPLSTEDAARAEEADEDDPLVVLEQIRPMIDCSFMGHECEGESCDCAYGLLWRALKGGRDELASLRPVLEHVAALATPLPIVRLARAALRDAADTPDSPEEPRCDDA